MNNKSQATTNSDRRFEDLLLKIGQYSCSVNNRRIMHDMNNLISDIDYTGRADPNLPTSIDPNINVPFNPLHGIDLKLHKRRIERTFPNDFLPTGLIFPNLNEERFTYDSSNPSVRSRGNILHRTVLPGP